ncbi:MAG: hypothetical protein IKY64_08090 [Bacteroidaceae bacterium]|nr:hypothetical protein [Bacteroidaceae bacterium]
MLDLKSKHTFICALPIFLLGLVACTQDIELRSESNGDDCAILFQAKEPTTRGLINSLTARGTKICLYGYHGDSFLAQGKSKQFEGKTLTYIDELNSWEVVDDSGAPINYFWEEEDQNPYRFFGWLTHDGTSQVPLPLSYSNETKKITIPETVVDKDYSQFDFLYSNVDERVLSSTNRRVPVSVSMNHLFTAFGIGIQNTSEDDITLKSVTLRTLHDKGSAVIDFSQTPCVVTYGNTAISRNPSTTAFVSYTGNHVLNKRGGTLPNIFDPTASSRRYYMVWPQAEDVFPELNFADDDAEAAAPDTDFPLVVEYVADGNLVKKRLKLPQQAWVAGKRYYFEVLIADKLVEITATVKDWNYSTSEINFSDQMVVVKENNQLVWDESTCRVDHSVRKVYVQNGRPIEGVFTIDAPEGGQWRVSLEGDVTAFNILDDVAPTDDGFGPIDGKEHRIRVVPLISNPDRDYTARLKFVAITADGKTLPADNMVQDVDGNHHQAEIYTIVLESAK